MRLTSLWSCACSTCFWLSNSSSSSLRALCSLRSSVCKASCSLDGLPKSESGVIRVKTSPKSVSVGKLSDEKAPADMQKLLWFRGHFDVVQFMIFGWMDLTSMRVQHTGLCAMLLPFVSNEKRGPALACLILKQEEYCIPQRGKILAVCCGQRELSVSAHCALCSSSLHVSFPFPHWFLFRELSAELQTQHRGSTLAGKTHSKRLSGARSSGTD